MQRLRDHGLTPEHIVSSDVSVLEKLINPVSFYKVFFWTVQSVESQDWFLNPFADQSQTYSKSFPDPHRWIFLGHSKYSWRSIEAARCRSENGSHLHGKRGHGFSELWILKCFFSAEYCLEYCHRDRGRCACASHFKSIKMGSQTYERTGENSSGTGKVVTVWILDGGQLSIGWIRSDYLHSDESEMLGMPQYGMSIEECEKMIFCSFFPVSIVYVEFWV